ncbi:MAG: hypothetical protein ACOX2A_08350 [Tepidanaerobacteraceae bacterium]
MRPKLRGFDVVAAVTVVDDKAHYYPGASSFIIKMIADREHQKTSRTAGSWPRCSG